MNRYIVISVLLLVCLLCPAAHATHIQYLSLATVSDAEIGKDESWTWTFDLVNDPMYLWTIATPTATYGTTPDPNVNTDYYMGSYDPLAPLHYVTLRIDPNNSQGDSSSKLIQLTVNGVPFNSWSNPIRLYDWGVPRGSISDPYGIAGNNYQIIVCLTGLDSLNAQTFFISNLNIEGCFEKTVSTPDMSGAPEPASMFLLGSGLIGLAVVQRKIKPGKPS